MEKNGTVHIDVNSSHSINRLFYFKSFHFFILDYAVDVIMSEVVQKNNFNFILILTHSAAVPGGPAGVSTSGPAGAGDPGRGKCEARVGGGVEGEGG